MADKRFFVMLGYPGAVRVVPGTDQYGEVRFFDSAEEARKTYCDNKYGMAYGAQVFDLDDGEIL